VKSGLITGSEIQTEMEQKKKQQAEEFSNMDPKLAGKNAPTIYRDRHGRPLRMLNKIAGVQDEESAMEWGVGKVDKDAQKDEKKWEEEEKGRGYHGVTFDDPQLNAELFDRDRFGDPMAGRLSGDKKKEKKNLKKNITLGLHLPIDLAYDQGFSGMGLTEEMALKTDGFKQEMQR